MKGVTFIKQVPYIKKLAKGYTYTHCHFPRMETYLIAHCNTFYKKIYFNTRDLELMPWYEVIETLLHEIAHISTNHSSDSHGPTWRREFNKLIAMLEEKCPGWVEPVEVEVKVESNTASVAKLVNAEPLKGSVVTPLEGSTPSTSTN